MAGGWEWALVFQSGLTALASSFNAFQFLVYPTTQRKRRWGAVTLMIINLAFLVQSLYLGFLPSLTGGDAGDLLENPRVRFFTGLLPLLASFLILTFVITRQRGAKSTLMKGNR